MAIPLLNDVESFKYFAMKRFFRNWFVVFAILGLPLQLLSQWGITGVVRDGSSGETLSGAHIRAVELDYSTISDHKGKYELRNLQSGNHTLEVSYMGYKSQIVTIDLRKDKVIDFDLRYEPVFNDEVIVTATRADQRVPATYSMVTGDDIAEQNFGQDLPYLFQLTPSVVTTSDAGAGIGYTGIRIRGTDITRINVTMNGVPLNDPESHAVFFVNMPDLASSLESVQIQRGVGTSTNGAAAFGASINMQTSRLNPEPFAEISSAAGSFNSFKNTIRFGSGLMDGKWAFDGRLSSITSDGYIDRGWSNLRSFYLSGGYYGKKTILKAIVTSGSEKTYQAWEGIPKDSLAFNRTYNPSGEMFDGEGNVAGYYNNQTDNYRQDYYQLHLAHQFNADLNLSSTLFYTKGKGYYESYRNRDRFSGYGFDNVIVGNDTINRSDLIRQKWLDNDFFGFNAAVNHRSSRFSSTLGGGLNHYAGDHFGYVIWSEYASNSFVDRKWYDNTGAKTDYHIFAKAAFDLSDVFIPYADIQYRHITYSIEGTHDDLADLTQDHRYSFFNPKAGITANLNSFSRLYASVAVANREPNRSVYRDADPGQVIKPERLTDYELGYRRKKSSHTVELTGYYMDYKDQLVLTGKINNVGAPVMTNVPESYRMGIEVAAGLEILKTLTWQLSATLSRNRIINFTEYVDNWNYWDDPANQPYQIENLLGETNISFSPDVITGSIVSWSPFRDFSAAFQSKYIGRQYIDNTSSEERSLDPDLIHDLRFSYGIRTGLFKQMNLMLSLNNIFNVAYESNAWVYRYFYEGSEHEINGYFPQAGFHFMAGLNIGF
jgi:iron complex outermembrane recepter protein